MLTISTATIFRWFFFFGGFPGVPGVSCNTIRTVFTGRRRECTELTSNETKIGDGQMFRRRSRFRRPQTSSGSYTTTVSAEETALLPYPGRRTRARVTSTPENRRRDSRHEYNTTRSRRTCVSYTHTHIYIQEYKMRVFTREHERRRRRSGFHTTPVIFLYTRDRETISDSPDGL